MQTFTQYMEDAWGSHEHDQQLISQIEAKGVDLMRDLNMFVIKLSHGDDPVKHAAAHFNRSLQTLVATFRTSVRKNVVNPERSDHPPVTIQ